MYNGKRLLAIIPARGGSKGLPGKNIRSLCGKPLLAWSVEAALESGIFDEVMVNTDEEQIAAVAERAGAGIPFLRPEKLATDEASTLDVILHALKWYSSIGLLFDIVVLLQPTSPLRTAEDVKGAVDLYFLKQAKAVVSVCEVEHHPFWMNTLSDDLNMRGFLRKEALNTPRQQLPKYYQLNGAVYVADTLWLQKAGSFFGPKTYAYVMTREKSVDIDNLIDFRLAELLLETEARD